MKVAAKPVAPIAETLVPPHSLSAEQGILGALLLDGSAMDRVADVIRSAHFYEEAHQVIYEAIATLYDGKKPIDVITVSDELAAKGLLDRSGGLAYLAELASAVFSTAAIASHARIVRSKAAQRYLAAACNRILQIVHEPGKRTPEQIIDEAESLILRVTTKVVAQDAGPASVKDVVQAVRQQLSTAPGANGLEGLSTGLDALDKITLGLCAPDLIVVGGRPSHGKTSLALKFLIETVVKRRQPGMIFSFEMSREQLALRLLSALSGISHQQIRMRKVSPVERDVFAHAERLLEGAPLYIDDTPGLDLNAVRARARRTAKKVGGLGIVVIDYLQMMVSADESDVATRNLQMQGISRGVKALAKELNAPVVALSQLNRSVERRANPRPILSDLRDSGSIEQDGDVIILIYCENAGKPSEECNDEEVELIVAKQRNGPRQVANVLFKAETMTFENFKR